MQEFGILNQLLPELANLVGLQQSDQVGDDAWTHTLMAVNYFQSILQVFLYEEEYEGNNALLKTALDRLISFRRSLQIYFSESVNPIRPLISQVFFAAIYHDVGKYPSRTIDEVGKFHFLDHHINGGDIVRLRAKVLALSNEEVDFIERTVRNHMEIHLWQRDPALDVNRAIHRYFKSAGKAGVSAAVFSLADLLAANKGNVKPERWEFGLEMVERILDAWFNHFQEIVNPSLLLNGNEIIDEFTLQAGPLIGGLLAGLGEEQAAGTLTDRRQALAWIQKQLDQGY